MSKSSAVVVFAVFLCMIVIAESITCDSVMKGLSPCRPAMKQGGKVTASCCSGVRSLNSGANTAPARKTACECVKKLASSYKVKTETINGVLKECKVNVGFAITSNVDCNKVH